MRESVEMKNLSLKICLVTAALFGSVGSGFANSVNGSFVCELVLRDGSGTDVYLKTTDRGMKIKRLDIELESQFVEIHRGKTNDFRVFVQIKNTITEDLVVLTATKDARVFHYNGTETDEYNDTVTARVVRGICKKV